MFNDNYIVEKKGIPLVTYYREVHQVTAPTIFTTMHYHSDFEMLYIKSGCAKMMIGSEICSVKDHSLLLINPYELHYGEILSEDFSYYCVNFNLALLDLEDTEDLLQKKRRYAHLLPGAEYEAYIHTIHQAYTEEPPNWKLISRGNLMLLFALLQTEPCDLTSDRESVFAKDVIDYLAQNYSYDISSKTIAETLNYDQSYFCRIFKKRFGYRFSHYLNIYRVEKAKEVLKTEKISDVAALCGFASPSIFSQIFKKQTGLTPMQYKNHLQTSCEAFSAKPTFSAKGE